MSNSKKKITVVGTGFVGASIAYTIAARNLAHEMVLIDVNREKAYGEALDISHSCPVFGSMKIIAGDYPDVKDSNVIIITAGVNRKPGETRMDLASKNVSITKSIVDEIMKYYNGGIFIIVSNPVDVLTTLVQKWTGLPAGKVIGSGTYLDTIRLQQKLYSLFDMNVKNIHAMMIGEHGETQFPYWSHATIAGEPLLHLNTVNGHPLTEEERMQIKEEVKTGGAEIIKNKGATYFGVASAVSDITDAILNGKDRVLPVSITKEEFYGFKNVAVSMPRIVSTQGVEMDIPVSLTPEEEELMKKSVENVYSITKEFLA
ncbi:MAG: L-lactate dehydrogenase [Clostridia bacterium]|nr:L-lactate dehydrogenase [Clostridia bacterium]